MKPRNPIYVGGPPLDPPDDEPLKPAVCPTCKGRCYVRYERIDWQTLQTIRGSYDCPDCCDDL